MRLFLLTSLTMLAFAANSVLNRMALVGEGMDAVVFAVLRLLSGAFALALMVGFQRQGFAIGGTRRVWGVGALLIYIFGFSMAYEQLDAGVGALVLFGIVQITMFVAAFLSKDDVPLTRWAGAGLAFTGLCWLLWPEQGGGFSVVHIALMVLAGLGWGIYSLTGRKEVDATQATAMNFILAAPIGAMAMMFFSVDVSTISAFAVALALVSGVVTSGMGYALWYSVLPALGASRGAVAQLTVPVIAMAGGLVFLGEDVTPKLILAAVLVLAGVGLSMRRA